jgi:hypothetical protein
MKLSSLAIVPMIAVSVLVFARGCKTVEGVQATSQLAAVDPEYANYRIMSEDQISLLTRNMPQINWAALDQIVRSPRTIWYDKKTMIPSYQDSVGDGQTTPIGARANTKGATLDVARPLFDKNGFKYPFGHTAGTDRASNFQVANFLSLPERDGARLPVVYWVERNKRSGLSGLGDTKWKWMYPRGTVVGEVIFVKDSQGGLWPVEIRTRTRWLTGWSTNVFRPFTSASELAAAVKSKRSDWASRPSLKAVVDQLESGPLTPKSLSSREFPRVFDRSGHVDVIPAFNDDELVKELLRTPFSSVFGAKWKTSSGVTTFAGSAAAGMSIFPVGYEAGVLSVDQETCAQCHNQTGVLVSKFLPVAVLYGDIWGEDGIFSFHPWDSSTYGQFNTENRRANPALERAGIITVYDKSKHLGTDYAEIQTN